MTTQNDGGPRPSWTYGERATNDAPLREDTPLYGRVRADGGEAEPPTPTVASLSEYAARAYRLDERQVADELLRAATDLNRANNQQTRARARNVVEAVDRHTPEVLVA